VIEKYPITEPSTSYHTLLLPDNPWTGAAECPELDGCDLAFNSA